MKREAKQTLKWLPYDPAWLVRVAEDNGAPPELLKAIRHHCTRCVEESRAYIRFVDAHNANRPGAEWQFDRNVRLEGGRRIGTLILDILQDGRVGGVEFLKRL